jgi:acetylornithine deacetylase/succinyl-diaminopimelate desuccinylase-like protein
MYTILRDKNNGLKDEVLSFAQKLVRTPSPSNSEAPAGVLVQEKMKELGYDKVVRDELGNVAGVLLGVEAGPTLLLECHLDTVGANGRWEAASCQGDIKNGLLHGLGSADCKGGLAAQIFAGALLKRCLLPLKGNLIVAATVAEENGRSFGLRALLEKTLPELELKPDYAILGEPTNMGLYYGHDGWLQAEVQIEGKNDFDLDNKTVRSFFQEYRDDQDISGGMLEEGAVLSTQTVHGPGHQRLRIETARRLHVNEQVGDVLGKLQRDAALMTKAIGGAAVEVQVQEAAANAARGIAQAWEMDPFSPLMERARHALGAAGLKARPGRWRLGRLGMGTAGGLLFNQFKIPVLGYGPGDEELAHASNEFVETAKICECVYGTAAIAHALIGVPVYGWTGDEI